MRLQKVADSASNGLTPVVSIFGKVGAGVLGIMMLFTVSDVAGRYLFNKPITGTYEISTLMLVVVSVFSLAYCQLKNGHTAVDILTSRLQPKTQNIIDIVTYILYFFAFCLLTYQLTQTALTEWETGTLVRNIEIPISPFVFVAVFGSALFALIIFVHLLQLLAKALNK